MSVLKISKKRIYAGIWEGVVSVPNDYDDELNIEVLHLENPVHSFSLVVDPEISGLWQLRIAIPPESLSDGVQVFLINDKSTGEKLGAFTIATGEALDEDLRSEVELLRAELDMLKRAFRRHCLEN